MSDREILMRLIYSLTLCDHMGDVSGDVDGTLKLVGIQVDFDDMSHLRKRLINLGHNKGIWDE